MRRAQRRGSSTLFVQKTVILFSCEDNEYEGTRSRERASAVFGHISAQAPIGSDSFDKAIQP